MSRIRQICVAVSFIADCGMGRLRSQICRFVRHAIPIMTPSSQPRDVPRGRAVGHGTPVRQESRRPQVQPSVKEAEEWALACARIPPPPFVILHLLAGLFERFRLLELYKRSRYIATYTSGVVDFLFWVIGKDVQTVRTRDGPVPAHAVQADVDPRFAGLKGHLRTFGCTAARPLPPLIAYRGTAVLWAFNLARSGILSADWALSGQCP